MFPEKIEILGNQDTPGVIFDLENKLFQISGRAFPADADRFFQPLIKWLDEYRKSGPGGTTVFDVKMEYFNTASAKMLLDIFFKFEDIHEEGNEVKVRWYFLEEDEDMFEAGEEFDEIVELEFEFVEYQEDY